MSLVMIAQPVTVTLQVNYENEAIVYHNSPVLLIVSIANQEARQAERLNNSADQYLDELKDRLNKKKITKEEYDADVKLLSSTKKQIVKTTIGSAAQPWVSKISWEIIDVKTKEKISLPIKLLQNPEPEAAAELGSSQSYFAFFGIDPDQLKKIKAGDYALLADVDGNKSEPILLKIQEGNMTKTIEESEEQLINIARYYWHSNMPADGFLYVNRVLKKNENSIEGLSLRGDLYLLQKKYLLALDDYNKALKIYYKKNSSTAEAPEYLIDMIAVVKEKMETK